MGRSFTEKAMGRDYYAGMALEGLVSSYLKQVSKLGRSFPKDGMLYDVERERIVTEAWAVADEMMRQRGEVAESERYFHQNKD